MSYVSVLASVGDDPTHIEVRAHYYLLPPQIRKDSLIQVIYNILDKCLTECKSLFILGDLNVDCLAEPHGLTDCF